MRIKDTGIRFLTLRPLAAAAAFTCAAALALGVSACDGDDSGGEAADRQLPDGAVAVVGEKTVSAEALDAQVAALRRARTSRGPRPTRDQLEHQALAVLLQRERIEQEAKRRGVTVRDADVRARWNAVVQSQLPTKQALRRFLRGQTEADVIAQLRLQALSEAIERDVRSKADGNPDTAVKRYRQQLDREAREDTTCRKGLELPACGG